MDHKIFIIYLLTFLPEVSWMELVYNLRIRIEQLEDGDYRYRATSPDLPNLIVAGDSVDEVLAEVPKVARALVGTMRELDIDREDFDQA
jgi:predicted RNase H-like HicB family nuclease